jgi:penicillin amidase
MRFLKLFISLTLTILLIWALGRSWQTGTPEKVEIDAKGNVTVLTEDTEKLIPPLGKLLSPSHGFWQNAEDAIPTFDASIYSQELTASVQVQYDDRMVPHIFADNLEDASFAQGYATAALRLWQMELQTHSAAGRLTEIFGTTEKRRKLLLPRDKESRRIGIPLGAERALERWKEFPEYKTIEAYCNGVNAYIESLSYDQLPIMYKLLDYKPEEWTPLKCALLLKNMGKTLTNRDHDFELTNTLKYLGMEQFDRLFPDYFEEQSPIILDSMNYIQPVMVSQADSINIYLGETTLKNSTSAPSPKGIGSNNWAVAGSKTASGNPILCNDPHLPLNLPSLWFEVQIHTPNFNSYGASLPGAPGVISGFNEHIAWGVTNVSHDVKDWYAIQWKDATKQEYWFDSTYRKTELRIETIQVRGQDPVYDTIYMTHMGPVARSGKKQDFALRWTLHDASEEPLTFIKLMRGKNYKDYQDAIKHFACPAQNIVFAAANGDIALWTQGKLPLRKKNQGKFIQYGTASSELWQGFIPQNDIPHEYNPPKGFVGSANQHSVNPNLYPYDYYGYFEEYRGRYLNRKLMAMDSITIQDMKDLQYDSYSVKAEDGINLLQKYLQTGKLKKEELEIWHQLRNWDLYYKKDKIEPTIFETWFNNLQPLIYDELEAIAKEKPLLANRALGFPEEQQMLHLLWKDTSNIILDIQSTPEKETIADVLTMAFQKSCAEIPRDSSNEILPWQIVRNTSIDHLSKTKQFGMKTIDSDGHTSALNALGDRPGPSWKMVVELGKEIKAYGIYPGGQSENPGSFFYDNMVEKWSKGEHYRLLFMPNASANADRIVYHQSFEN